MSSRAIRKLQKLREEEQHQELEHQDDSSDNEAPRPAKPKFNAFDLLNAGDDDDAESEEEAPEPVAQPSEPEPEPEPEPGDSPTIVVGRPKHALPSTVTVRSSPRCSATGTGSFL